MEKNSEIGFFLSPKYRILSGIDSYLLLIFRFEQHERDLDFILRFGPLRIEKNALK